MRLAALYDIHGNLPALEAVLRDVRSAGVDAIVCGGDVVPGPMPREVLEVLLNLEVPTTFICGNGDREVLAIRAGSTSGRFPETIRRSILWSSEQLDDESVRAMSTWLPDARVAAGSLGDVLFCHATPRSDTQIFLRTTAEEPLLPIFDAARAPVIICGHTHMQFDRTIGKTRVANAGSVGMSFQGRGAYWLLLGKNIEFRCTTYDFERAATRIRATRYPQAEEFAERNVLNPPSEAETIAAFSKYEIR